MDNELAAEYNVYALAADCTVLIVTIQTALSAHKP